MKIGKNDRSEREIYHDIGTLRGVAEPVSRQNGKVQ